MANNDFWPAKSGQAPWAKIARTDGRKRPKICRRCPLILAGSKDRQEAAGGSKIFSCHSFPL